MSYKNFYRWLENTYMIDIDKNLQNILEEHFGDSLNIYTEEDLYEKSEKTIQLYRDRYYKKLNKK